MRERMGEGAIKTPDVELLPPPRRDSLRALQAVAGDSCTVFVASAEGPLGFRRQVVVKRVNRSDNVAGVRALTIEARALARMPGSHVLQLIDFLLDHKGRATLVLEYVPDFTLRQLVERCAARQRRIPVSVCAHLASRVFGALALAHEARDPATGEVATIVHGSVGLDSVLMGYDGRVTLLDFGGARLAGDDEDDAVPRPTARDDIRAGVRLLRALLHATEKRPLPGPIADVLACAEGTPTPVGARLYASTLAAVPCGRAALRAFVQSLREAEPEETAVVGWRAVADSLCPRVAPPTPIEGVELPPLPRVRSRRGGRGMTLGGIALLACALTLSFVAQRNVGGTWTARERAVRAAHTPAPAPARSLVLRSASRRLPTTSVLVVPPTLGEWRVTVDGHILGNAGAITEIPCGEHVLQLGRTGRRQAILAPCGGEVRLGR
jgi:hypothetical protein